MATFTRPDKLSENIGNKVHDFDSDTFRWVLTNTAPAVGTTFLASDITSPLSTAGGYTAFSDGAGGLLAVMAALSRTGAVTTIAHNGAIVLTATGAVGPFRYPVMVDDTPTSPLNPVVGWLDHASSITMANTDTYTLPTGSLFTIG